MSWQIIKQEESPYTPLHLDGLELTPGLFCIRSSVVEGLIAYNLTGEEVIKVFVDEATSRAQRAVRAKLEMVEAGQNAYHQFRVFFHEALAEEINRRT